MELLTIAQIAKNLEVPESTVRYYRDKLEIGIPCVGSGRSRRYLPEALDVFRQVMTSSKKGLPLKQVQEALAGSEAGHMEVAAAHAHSTVPTHSPELGALRQLMASEFTAIHQEISAMQEMLSSLIREQAESQVGERDRQLVEALKGLQSMKNPPKRKWFPGPGRG